MSPDAATIDTVHTLWTVALVLSYLLLPIAVYWLHSLWRAADSIRRYARDSVVAAEAIAQHTAALPALDRTIAVATELLGAAESVTRKLDTMAGALEARAGGRS